MVLRDEDRVAFALHVGVLQCVAAEGSTCKIELWFCRVACKTTESESKQRNWCSFMGQGFIEMELRVLLSPFS